MDNTAAPIRDVLVTRPKAAAVGDRRVAVRPVGSSPRERSWQPILPRTSSGRLAFWTRTAAIDLVALTLGGAAVGELVHLRFPAAPPVHAGEALLVVFGGMLALLATGSYGLDAVVDRVGRNARLAKAGALAMLIGLAAASLPLGGSLARSVAPPWRLAIAVAGGFLAVAVGRALNRVVTVAGFEQGRLQRRAVVVGSGTDAVDLVEQLNGNPEAGVRVVGVLGDIGLYRRRPSCPWLGSDLSKVASAVTDVGATAVFVAASGLPHSDLTALRRRMAALHVDVHVVVMTRGLAFSRLRTVELGSELMTCVELEPSDGVRSGVKRASDLLIGLPLTIALLPVMALVGLVVLVSNGRPVLFRQVRVGRDGRPFRMLKFRTMVRDAESRLEDLAAHNEREGPLFKLTDDPRVTKVGRLLRASSIDELPQLFNVLMGHMGLVGPRPALADEVERFDDDLRSRHRIRPGVTGLWQIRGRDSACFETYERLDLFYVEHWSLSMDLSILARTGPAVLRRALRRRDGRTRRVVRAPMIDMTLDAPAALVEQ